MPREVRLQKGQRGLGWKCRHVENVQYLYILLYVQWTHCTVRCKGFFDISSCRIYLFYMLTAPVHRSQWYSTPELFLFFICLISYWCTLSQKWPKSRLDNCACPGLINKLCCQKYQDAGLLKLCCEERKVLYIVFATSLVCMFLHVSCFRWQLWPCTVRHARYTV